MTQRNYLLTNAMIPGTLGMFRWEEESRCIKDITLHNQFAQQNRIAQMSLSVTSIGIINDQGSELKILDFDTTRSLKVGGIRSGKNLRISKVKDLPFGHYVAIRFYLNHADNSYIKSNREYEVLPAMEFLQFEMEEGLKIDSAGSPDLLLRFAFAPYQAAARFESFGALLKNANDRLGFGRKLVQKFR